VCFTRTQEEGVAAVHEAVRLGVNFIDCSPCVAGAQPRLCLPACLRRAAQATSDSAFHASRFYGDTRAERVLGRALKDIPRSEARRPPHACVLRARARRVLCARIF
jgi:hypothetical protein